MNNNIRKRAEAVEASDVFRRVKEIQASMAESAKSLLDESELAHLRCLIRLTVEFHDYLEHGRIEIATSILNGPHAKYVPDAENAGRDPFNKYDLEYVCESVRSGIESFCTLNTSYRMLDNSTNSKVEWSTISSKESFKANYASMFNRFTQEANFETKCRLLLDMFKLQIVFAGISYGG